MRKNPGTPEAGPAEKLEEKPFLEHLEDLRHTIIRALIVFGAAFLVCIPLTLKGITIGLLKHPLFIAVGRIKEGPIGFLPTLYPAGGVAIAMRVSIEAALIVSLPLLLYIMGNFILPALTLKERQYFVPALAAGAGLFYGGMAFCYFTALPWTLRFFWNFNRLMGIDNLWTINEYIVFASRLLLAFGLVFEFPLVILSLVRIGILNYHQLSEKRRYAIVIIFILAAVMTPGPDMISQVTMALPLLLLYEVCVWGARLIGRDETSRADRASGEGRELTK